MMFDGELLELLDGFSSKKNLTKLDMMKVVQRADFVWNIANMFESGNVIVPYSHFFDQQQFY